MGKLKKWFKKNFPIVLMLFMIVGNFVAYFYYGEILKQNDYIWPSLLTTEIVTLYLVIELTIINPINELWGEIANFITGGKKGQKIEISSANPTLQNVINFFNKALDILKNFKEELHSGKELKSEVQLASEIQKNTLTKNLPKIHSMNIVANTKSATEVGGDSYDVIQEGNNYYIYLGDVTGHGVASGFVMMMVNALVSGFAKKLVNSAEIIAHTNEILKPRVPSNMLMTVLMVRWNEEEKKMYMTGAGHEYLMIYKKSQNKAFKLKSGGVALGMTKNISKIVKEIQIQVEKGDIIVLYTDGITEARNTNREDGLMFGVEKLLETIESAPFKTAQGVFNNITIELSKWMGYNHRQFDDITLITMHYNGGDNIEYDANPVIPKENITEWFWS